MHINRGNVIKGERCHISEWAIMYWLGGDIQFVMHNRCSNRSGNVIKGGIFESKLWFIHQVVAYNLWSTLGVAIGEVKLSICLSYQLYVRAKQMALLAVGECVIHSVHPMFLWYITLMNQTIKLWLHKPAQIIKDQSQVKTKWTATNTNQ